MAGRDELEGIARRWTSLWSAPLDRALFDRLHADDFEDRSSAGRPSDKRGFAAGVEAWIAAFPDLATEVVELVVDEPAQRVAIAWRSVGTNRARYLGVGPTGRETRITGIEIVDVRDGRVVRRWGEWDVSDHRP